MSELVIVGSGNVGKAIYVNCKRNNVEVLLASRNPQGVDSSIELKDRISLSEVFNSGNLILLAIPVTASIELVQSVPEWAGKTLIDSSNPLMPGLEGLSMGTTTSAGEAIAKVAKNANVVKAFNTTGASNLAHPKRISHSIFTPICGDDQNSKNEVVALATKLGFDAVDFGDLKTARYTEAFAMTWIHLTYKKEAGVNWAFSRSFEA